MKSNIEKIPNPVNSMEKTRSDRFFGERYRASKAEAKRFASECEGKMDTKTGKRSMAPSGHVKILTRTITLYTLVVLIMGCRGKPASDETAQIWQNWVYNGSYTLTIDPPRALLDTPVSIRASGLEAKQPVVIRARMQWKNQVYGSFAAFTADSSGQVDARQMASLMGSYTGVDGMGLFWSMERIQSTIAQAKGSESGGLPPRKVTFTLEAKGQILARQEFEQLFFDETQVERREINEPGMIATFYLPKQPGLHAGIVFLGGSDGGLSESFAALLASHGYAAMALAYFKAGSLPKELVLLPIESVKENIDWFRNQPEVDRNRIALLGVSKGAELALLLAATYPEDIQAVVGYKPSSVVWVGMPTNQADSIRNPKSSWTLNEQPLPFVNMTFTPEALKVIFGKPAAIVNAYAGGLKDKKAVEAARIPVENIRGPILLLSGEDDQLWPSTQMSEQVVAQLDKSNFPYRYEHWAYKDAGHGLGLPYFHTTEINQGTLLLGGTPQGTAIANVDAWEKTLEFLSNTFLLKSVQ